MLNGYVSPSSTTGTHTHKTHTHTHEHTNTSIKDLLESSRFYDQRGTQHLYQITSSAHCGAPLSEEAGGAGTAGRSRVPLSTHKADIQLC